MADQEYQVVLERLVELGKLDKAQKTQAIHVCQSWRKLEEFLEKSCQIDPWFLAKIRAENSGWMFAEWRANVERIALMRQLSKVSVQSYCCVPLEVKQDTLAVGFSEQPTPEMRNVLKSAFTNCSKLSYIVSRIVSSTKAWKSCP